MKLSKLTAILAIAISVTMLAGCGSARRVTTMQVGSYNIRYDSRTDSLRGNGWGQRCPVIASQIIFHDLEIFGAQEGKHEPLELLKSYLPGYEYIGVGRDDGKEKGEHSAIFYKTELFDLLDHGDFWLSQTPDVPSIGWDAALNRICTWGRFKVKGTGQEFFYFNLHMDHIGVQARLESAKLVVSKIREISGGKPVILTGDFNVDQTSPSYAVLTGSGILEDSYEVCEIRYALNGTANGFDPNSFTTSRIDHVFVTPGIRVIRYGVLTDTYRTKTPEAQQYENGNFPKEISFQTYQARTPSDHFPVKVILQLPKK
ncbi:MAG: endonuclease/exonuclease/phosphatase family protein [Bacteroidales bacterium]|nr:endonuclease/exonuclease/phosphatase family protein [Bacteroidales bacterium]